MVYVTLVYIIISRAGRVPVYITRVASSFLGRRVPVTLFDVQLGVTAVAQSHEVGRVIATSADNSYDVMTLRRRCHPAFTVALLAERVFLHVPVSNHAPVTAVLPMDVGITLVAVVQPPLLDSVFITVLAVS